jgi:hypothetical protein
MTTTTSTSSSTLPAVVESMLARLGNCLPLGNWAGDAA